MERQEIYDRIAAAKSALKPTADYAKSVDGPVTKNAHTQYATAAIRLFDKDANNKIIRPRNAKTIIDKVQQTAQTKSTLRKYARSVRYVASLLLNDTVKTADQYQRQGDWQKVENIIGDSRFEALTQLAAMLPAEYDEGWTPQRKRKSKKVSLRGLPKDWREQMISASNSQKYKVPMMVAMMTGCRPAELEKGITLTLKDGALYAKIESVKVKENAGQPYRQFKLSDHKITKCLIHIMKTKNQTQSIVKVEKGNSVSTHMRSIGKKLWPKRKESITVYTARHAMAADCKAADQGQEENLASKVLGHVVDKTASYYGASQQGTGNVVPSEIKVPKPVRQKQKSRNKQRKESGLIPSKNRPTPSKSGFKQK